MFSVDWPYAGNDEGRRLLDSAPLSPADMEKLTHLNAERLLGLSA
jgi:predicted TIM-barrel fold metal-dependent hydrolase